MSNTQTLVVKVDAAGLSGRLTGTEGIVLDIFAERDRQDAQWGGPDHDDAHSGSEWLSYIGHQRDRALRETLVDGLVEDPVQYRERLVKIAALAIAALESHDRLNSTVVVEEDKPKRFSSQELVGFLGEALREECLIQSFEVTFYSTFKASDQSVEEYQRIVDTVRNYRGNIGDGVRIETRMDFHDGTIHLSVKA